MRRLAFFSVVSFISLVEAAASTPPDAAAALPLSAIAAGSNAGSADSFVGPQTWYVEGLPGSLAITIDTAANTQDSVPLTGTIGVRAALGAPVRGDTLTIVKTGPHELVIHGMFVKPARILVTITPPNSPLVRVARNYTIAASGSVAFAAGGADPIVGPYLAHLNSYGATRFAADGTITASDGETGRWTLFDPALRIYTITIGSARWTVKLVAGRGLSDASNENLYFERAH